MCGRYGAFRPPNLLADDFDVPVADELPPPSWNVAPTDPAPVVLPGELRTFRWGIAGKVINARAETVAEKFRSALVARRCLVPADGWYEWRDRRPHFIHAAGPLAFAGIHAGDAFAIVTTSAAPDIAHLHDRMPVVLPRELWELWLDPEIDDVEALRGLLVPRTGCTAYEVGTAVNSVRNNGPSLLDPPPEENLLF